MDRQVCVQLPTYADNVAMPTFARRMQLLLSAGRAAIDRYLLPAAAGLLPLACWDTQMHRQTDRQTDGWTEYR